jgi:ABC-type dipeptide/oligopeptide/nickel transport system permease component
MNKIITWILILIFPTALIIFVLVFNIFTFIEWKTAKELHNSGITTQATVIELNKPIGLKAPNSYFIKYRYEINQSAGDVTSYTKKKQINENLYQRLKSNSQVTISYLPSEPEISDVQGNKVLDRRLIVCVSIDVAFILFILALLLKVKN